MESLPDESDHPEEFVDGHRGTDVHAHVANVEQPGLPERVHTTLIHDDPYNGLNDQKSPTSDLGSRLVARVTEPIELFIEILQTVPDSDERFSGDYRRNKLVHSHKIIHDYLR